MELPLSAYGIEATASSQRLQNCFVEKAPEGAKGPLVLRRSPGIAPHATPGGQGRGLHTMGGVLYAVSGAYLYSVSAGGVSTNLGTVGGTDLNCMANNGTQLYISAGYIYDGSVHAITDPDYTPGSPGSFFDNYLLLARLGTGQLYSSDLADFETYDALFFTTTEGAPDNVLCVPVDHRQGVAIGELTTELYDNQGGSGFPFIRASNGFIEIGGAGPFASTKQDQSVHWLANDRTLRRLSGNTAVRTSLHGFERAVRGYTSVSDCQMFSYSLDGHLYVVIRFPDVATWVYDCTTQQMHERVTYGRSDWDVSGFAEAYGKVFVQRASDGAIGVLSKDVYDDFGETMVASWTYANLYKQGERITLDRLEMGVETGVGLTGGDDPRISLEVSYDGGRVYQALAQRSIGLRGEYRTRVHWDRLGSGFDLVVRGSLSDPVPLTVWDTTATVR